MSQEPTFPADATPGRVAAPAEVPAAESQPASLESTAALTPFQSAIEAAGEIARSRRWQTAAGVAIGVGSAAVAAALLYANRPKRD